MKSKKSVLILGSTGSIGCSTLNVISQHPDKFEIKTLVAKSSVMKLAGQGMAHSAENVVITDEEYFSSLKSLLSSTKVKVFAGKEALLELMEEEYDITIAAISGIEGFESLIKVIPNTKILGIVNKESVICAGKMLNDLAKRHGTIIVPVDSEHSGIFQTLEKNNFSKVSKITLTASGGPFLEKNLEEMSSITPKEAINHPTWSMGLKNSVDSATLMNKGLELIEAQYLFDLQPSQLEAVIHPSSVVHSLVSYSDGSTIAQMSNPDMRIPISLALSYPERISINVPNLNFLDIKSLNFFAPDEKKFPLLKLAKLAMIKGHSACIILNVANEAAVNCFLKGAIGFLDIHRAVDRALERGPFPKIESLDSALDFTKRMKEKMKRMISNIRLSKIL